MIDIILAIKFVHVLFAAVMLGAWLGIAAFMVFAHRSHNASVIALIAQFVVRARIAGDEKLPVTHIVADQRISARRRDRIAANRRILDCCFDCGLCRRRCRLAWCRWFVGRIPHPTHGAAGRARRSAEWGADYQRFFRIWLALAVLVLSGMTLLFLLMIWQPRLN